MKCSATLDIPDRQPDAGWKPIARQDIFQRFDAGPTLPPGVKPAPETRRARFAFAAPEARAPQPLQRQVEALRAPRELALSHDVEQEGSLDPLLERARAMRQGVPAPQEIQDAHLPTIPMFAQRMQDAVDVSFQRAAQPEPAPAPKSEPLEALEDEAPAEAAQPEALAASPTKADLIDEASSVTLPMGGAFGAVEVSPPLEDPHAAGEPEVPELETVELERPEAHAALDQPDAPAERAQAPEPLDTMEPAKALAPATPPGALAQQDADPAQDSAELGIAQPEEPGLMSAPAGSKRRLLPAGALIAALLVAFAAGIFLTPLLGERAVAREPEGAVGVAAPVMISISHASAQASARAQASTLVMLAARQDWRARSRKLEVARELLESGKPGRAAKVFALVWEDEPGARDARLARDFSQALVGASEFQAARQIAMEGGVLTDDEQQLGALGALWREAAQRDPALHPEVQDIVPDEEIDEIRALGGGKSLSFKMRRAGENLYAFKPAQFEWAEGWRAEVASYLLCEAIPCNFEVPQSLPARITRADFETLYGRHTSSKQRDYKKRFGELTWVTETAPDGTQHEVMYGVLKAWVPGFAEWPIEYTDIWQPLLDSTASQELLERDFTRTFRRIKFRQQNKYWPAIINTRGHTSVKQVASGISSLLLFDFLTSNWDRFSQIEAYYGVNNHFREGRFLSLDNGAAFHLQPMQFVAQRFALTTRFSERMVLGIRWMSPEVFNEILFPQASSEGNLRLDVFWAQRKSALATIDALLAQHPPASVLAFQ